MTRRVSLLVLAAVALATPVVRADEASALAHVDAILYAKKQADAQVRMLTTQLSVALDDANARDAAWKKQVDAAELRATNAEFATSEINNSWAYWIGWVQVKAFRWWITAFLIAFGVRILCSLPWIAMNPTFAVFATVGAHVSTWVLHALTLGLTLATNIPDNLYFLGKIKRLKAERQAAQLAANDAEIKAAAATAGAA